MRTFDTPSIDLIFLALALCLSAAARGAEPPPSPQAPDAGAQADGFPGDPLLLCARDAAVGVPDPAARCGLLLDLAGALATRSPAVALRIAASCPGTRTSGEPLDSVLAAASAIDPEGTLAFADRYPGPDARLALLAGLAARLAPADISAALAVARLATPRLAREFILLGLLDLAPSGAEQLLDLVVEPLLNDFGAARMAALRSRTGNVTREEIEEAIESGVVRAWALRDVAVTRAAREPDAALGMEPDLKTPVHRDDLYRAASLALVANHQDRALSIALRIGDWETRCEAVEDLAAAIFPDRPGLAIHLLDNHLPETEVGRLAREWFVSLCMERPARFAKAWRQAREKLPGEVGARILNACCPHAPEDVSEIVVADLGEGSAQPPWLVRCRVCAGRSAAPLEAALAISDLWERNAALECAAVSGLSESPQRTRDALEEISDALTRDQARGAVVHGLLRLGRQEEAAGVAAEVRDRYVAASLDVDLLAAQPLGDGSEGRWAALLERIATIPETWRRDDLLCRAAWRLIPLLPWRALEAAAAIHDGTLRRRALSALSLSGRLDASFEVLFGLDPLVCGEWCMEVFRRGSGSAEVP